MKRIVLFRVLLGLCMVTFLSGCMNFQKLPYRILDYKNIDNIKIGETSKIEIVELFGIPDIIVCGSGSTIIPKTSFLSIVETHDKASIVSSDNSMKYLIEYVESKKNYNLSNDQITFIYFDTDFEGRAKVSSGSFGLVERDTEIYEEHIMGNELAIFIDKRNDIVSDYAFRKEWSWEESPAGKFAYKVDRATVFSESEIAKFWSEKYCNDGQH